MTVVISIRLDSMNSRERKALQVLQNWNKKGYGNRYTIVEALLNLEKEQTDEVIDRITQIEKLIMNLQTSENYQDKKAKASSTLNSELTEEFKEAIKNNLRKGIERTT